MNKKPSSHSNTSPKEVNPWVTLWVMMIGFFMLMLDVNIVSVANPSIQEGLDASVTSVIWVTSSYLLAYSVPMLIAGRLGDRFGPKRVFIVGLLVFTIASLGCGLADTLPGTPIVNLIIARAVQGVGAALMSPQTMAVIQRTFPPRRRGGAMAIIGAAAGVGSLVGPILGGFIVDTLGWEWIFFVNVPIGIVAAVLSFLYIPNLQTRNLRLDWVGVVISALGVMFFVFGIQEGNSRNWDWQIIALIAAGIVMLLAFVWWESITTADPLVPLQLFRDRNFSISTSAMALVGFSVTSVSIPLYYYFQVVRGLTPTQSALLTLPAPILGILLARPSGKLIDRIHPRTLALFGLGTSALGVWLYVWITTAEVNLLWMLVPSFVYGLGGSFMWGPLNATATKDFPPEVAGAAAGVYNTSRQMGSVIGSAATAAVISSRLAHYMPGVPQTIGEGVGGAKMSSGVAQSFTSALTDSLMLPAVALLVATVLAGFLVLPKAHMVQEVSARDR